MGSFGNRNSALQKITFMKRRKSSLEHSVKRSTQKRHLHSINQPKDRVYALAKRGPKVHDTNLNEEIVELKEEEEKQKENNKRDILLEPQARWLPHPLTLEKQYRKESKPNKMGKRFSERESPCTCTCSLCSPCLCILSALFISVVLC